MSARRFVETFTGLGSPNLSTRARTSGVRLAGLLLRRAGRTLDASQLADVLGEVAIAERALLGGLTIEGPIRASVFVENLGAFQDLTPPPGWLVIHVAGWDTAALARLLPQLAVAPAVHFGDLDPNGLRIFRHLRGLRPDLVWALPAFWEEHIPDRAQAGAWPTGLDLAGVPPLVGRLAAEGLWLEQEAIVLDPRLAPSLSACLEPAK